MKKTEELRYPKLIPWLRTLTVGIIRFLVFTLARVNIKGIENVPAEGPVMVAVNHLHHLDAPVVGVTIPRKDTWSMAAEKYQNHVFGPILRAASAAIFIERGEVDRRALRQTLNVLEDGHCLAIAPEGTRSDTGGLQQPKTGAAYLATRSNAAIVPVAVWGTEQIIPAWSKLRRAQVHIHYGEPFYLPEGRARSQQLEAYTERIMLEIARMLPASYHGVYSGHPRLDSAPGA